MLELTQDFYKETKLRGPSVFMNGYCYEYAYAMYEVLKEKGIKSEVVFVRGNMKKQYILKEDIGIHNLHAIIKVKRSYYDINGRLGSKRDILSAWYKFENKNLISSSIEELATYIVDRDLIKTIKQHLKENR